MELNLHKLVLYTLHLLYSLFEYLQDLRFYIRKYLSKNNTSSVLHKEYINQIVQLKKVPEHLTVLIGYDNASLKDLANLVLWCLAVGIPYISFYDHTGSLKKRENELRCEIQNRKIIKGQVLWNSNGFSNGQNTSSDKIYVKLLSISDGKEAIVKATKEFSKYNKPEEVTIDSVDSMLKRFYQFPDPNLGLYSGRQFVLYSYPPWQIRFTEFINGLKVSFDNEHEIV